MRVYVAAASSEHARARAFIERIGQIPGVETIGDWTQFAGDARASGITNDRQLTQHARLAIAETCRRAVTSCNVFVYLSPLRELKTEGASWELGYVQARRDLALSAADKLGHHGEMLRDHAVKILAVGEPMLAMGALCPVVPESVAIDLLTRWAGGES